MLRLSGIAVAVCFVLASVCRAGLVDGLIGYWELNGDYSDSTLDANDLLLTPSATAPTFVAGVAGTAAHFDSTAFAYTTSSPITGGAARTLNAWVCADTMTSPKAAICWGIGGTTGSIFDLYLRPSDTVWGGHFYGGSYDTLAAPNPTYTVGQWYMATLVYDGNRTVSVYHNGSLVDETTLPGVLNTNGTGLSLGGSDTYGYSVTQGFSGSLDEVAVWDRVLTAGEISRIYSLGISGQRIPEPGTIGLLACGLFMFAIGTRRRRSR